MTSRDHYELMATYNQWMNQKLYAICATIPDRNRKEDLGAFFQSIHGTLNHLLYADRVWLGRFQAQPVAGNVRQELYADFDQLRQARTVMDEEILTWTKQLSEHWLAQPFEYRSGIDGKTRILPTWVLVTHLFNHQTHHRGQLTTLLTQLGYDPGVTDIPWMPQFAAFPQ